MPRSVFLFYIATQKFNIPQNEKVQWIFQKIIFLASQTLFCLNIYNLKALLNNVSTYKKKIWFAWPNML